MPDAREALIPLAIFAAGVSALLYFWPRAPKVLLESRRRKRVQILDVHEVSGDTKRFRLSLGAKGTILGLPCGKHLVIYCPNPSSCIFSSKWNGQADPDKGKAEIERKYTPVTGDETSGYVDLIIKIYRPAQVRMPDGKESTWEDGGKMSLYLDKKKPGDFIDIEGPIGIIQYLGRGSFKVPGRTLRVKHVGMMAGGTGITPMLQVVKASLKDKEDTTVFSLIYANKTENDILVKDQLDQQVAESRGRFKVTYTLDFPPANWTGKSGFITTEMIKAALPPPEEKPLVLMCGPPPMVEFACKKNLDSLGYDKKSMMAF